MGKLDREAVFSPSYGNEATERHDGTKAKRGKKHMLPPPFQGPGRGFPVGIEAGPQFAALVTAGTAFAAFTAIPTVSAMVAFAARGAGGAGGVFGLPFDALFFEEDGLAAGTDAVLSECLADG